MNKAELIKLTAARTGLSSRAVDSALKAAFAIIREKGHLEYRGFGVFRTKQTGVRTWHTPWNGEANVTLGKKKLVFDESKPRRGGKNDPRRKTE